MIAPEYLVTVKGGKSFPIYAGVLDAATRAGLRSLITTVLQIPSAENGGMAVVMARAEFEDGRVFQDVGDCSPASTSPQLAAAALRLASTRAKGRVLRDAINVGTCLLEELPDQELEERSEAGRPTVNGNGAAARECSNPGCGKPLTQGQEEVSRRGWGQALCPSCQRQYTRIG